MRYCMNWRSISFDWNRAKAFLVTAEEGSFSAAGRALGIAQPTIGRQVKALEQELDVVLFERVGHGLQLTPTGLDLLEHVRVMGDAALGVSRTAAGQSLSLDGTVCISASQIIATHILPPIIALLRERHPGIEVEILATNNTSDLSRRDADIAIRSYRPTQPDLVARKVRDGRARLYASPGYLDQIGNPQNADELSQGQFLGFDREDTLMNGLNALGLSLTPSSFAIVTENQLVQWELAKLGAGIAIMMEEVGDLEPRVQRALPDLPPFPVPMWLTTHRELSTSRRMRVVFDLLLAGLQAHVRVRDRRPVRAAAGSQAGARLNTTTPNSNGHQ
jgi:DNA-binding transcriptional LysR family regulator